MKYRIRKTDKVLKGEVRLEGSKSITNRILIIKALCDEYFDVINYSKSDDSQILYKLINSHDKVLNAQDGGTTLRFLLAYLSIHEGEVILTGSERMIERPIGPLVDALVSLGADIQYLAKRNYPPVLIRGKMLQGNKVEVDAGISSQFISALLLIAPVLKAGLIIKLRGEVVSKPYIQMTLDVMKHCGISYEWSQNVISIAHQDYTPRDFRVEADWSAASYYYEMAALADEVDLRLYGLHKISSQGDAVIKQIMENFGVTTTYIDNGIHLSKNAARPSAFEFDFKECPDLAQTMIACCAGMNIPAKITGITNLQIKETNRIQAMHNELGKINRSLEKSSDQRWELKPADNPHLNGFSFDTYRDHRMALSLAPLAIPFGEVVIDKPEVVSKSYPSFWKDIQQVGFEVEVVK